MPYDRHMILRSRDLNGSPSLANTSWECSSYDGRRRQNPSDLSARLHFVQHMNVYELSIIDNDTRIMENVMHEVLVRTSAMLTSPLLNRATATFCMNVCPTILFLPKGAASCPARGTVSFMRGMSPSFKSCELIAGRLKCGRLH